MLKPVCGGDQYRSSLISSVYPHFGGFGPFCTDESRPPRLAGRGDRRVKREQLCAIMADPGAVDLMRRAG